DHLDRHRLLIGRCRLNLRRLVLRLALLLVARTIAAFGHLAGPPIWAGRGAQSLPELALSAGYPGLIGPRSGDSVLGHNSFSQRSVRPVVEGPADAPHEVLSIGDVVERGEPIGEQLLG